LSRALARATIVLISGLIAFMLSVAPVRADGGGPLALRYGVYWAGFQIATLTLEHQVRSTRYRSQLLIETVGLVEKLVRYRAKTSASGRLGEDGLLPVTYSSEYRSRKKDRRSIVKFDPQSGDVVDLEITKRGKPDDSDVPEELRKNVTDPLTAFFQLRDHLATADQGDVFTAKIFDGRRRFDVAARMLGRDRAWIAGRQQRVVKLALTLEFLAGADHDDLDEVAVEDNRIKGELLLSADERLLPLRLRLLHQPLGGSIELLEDCSSEAGCQLASR
jgi:Protein of unknown function (DUF3108)